MRYAIISDIHSNLEALEAVMESIEAAGITNYVCGGDIVGYGANPVETLEIVRALGCKCVLGNHDAAAVGKMDLSLFNSVARVAAVWTEKQLSPEGRQYLQALPLVERVESFTVVHSSLPDPALWSYIFNAVSAEEHFYAQKDLLCFIGHTHMASAYMFGEMVQPVRKTRFRLSGSAKFLVNAGSVGQPRDRNPDACYVIYNLEEGTIEYKRVPYDIEKAQKKIRDAGLPEILASRLSSGK